MFNAKNHINHADLDTQLLRSELNFFDIIQSQPGYEIAVGDEYIHTDTLAEAIIILEEGVSELKEHIWEKWNSLDQVAKLIIHNNAGNEGGIENILFLNSVKKAYLLSRNFSDLENISESIKQIFSIDASEVHPDLIRRFNDSYLSVRLIHKLIMTELYKIKLIRHYMRHTKTAGISGPWANLDLPMAERVWDWSEDEEYFQQRAKARKEQTRYNPEMDRSGFFYNWVDLSRDPYTFTLERSRSDSPYKSRNLISLP